MSRVRQRDTVQEQAVSPTVNPLVTIDCPSNLPGRRFVPLGWPVANAGQYVVPAPSYLNSPGCTGESGLIEDESMSPGTFNRCYHTKTVWDCAQKSVLLDGICDPDDGVARSHVELMIGTKEAASYGLSSVPFLGTDEQLLAEASSSINPQVVKPAFDSALQLGELIETGSALRKGLSAFLPLFDDIIRESSLQQARRLIKSKLRARKGNLQDWSVLNWVSFGNSLGLGYKFAVKPLFNAWKQFLRANDRYRSELQRVLDSTRLLHGVASRSAIETDQFSPTTTPHQWGNVRRWEKKVYATAEIKYSSPLTSELVRKFDRAYFGAIPSVHTAWALTPLSFIVDYFADISSVLASWARSPISDIGYSVVNSGWSVKTTVQVDAWLDPCTAPAFIAYRSACAPPLVTGRVVRSTYLREPKALDLESFTPMPLQLKVADVDQMITIAQVALAIQSGHKSLLRAVHVDYRS